MCKHSRISEKAPYSFLFTLIFLLSFCPLEVSAQTNLDTLKFGMSTTLSGPASELGKYMRQGVELKFNQVNQVGGIHGRKIELITLDDGYEPVRTAPNMRKLMEEERVLAIVGNVGTPTAVTAVPIAIEQKTLFFAPYTGAGFLRKSPPDRYVINFRASYAQEISEMVDALIKYGKIRPHEIAFFTQRDSYGDAGFAGGLAALKRYGITESSTIPHGRYERNTVSVENGLADILSAPIEPKAVIMVGAYAPCGAFIKKAREYSFNAIFLNVSFVGSAALASELGPEYSNVVVTQVVPPLTAEVPIVSQYHEALNSQLPGERPSFGALEGYISASILVKALESISTIPNRENLIDALTGLGRFDIGLGRELELSSEQHQASQFVWPTILEDGSFKSFDWESLSKIVSH